MHRENLMLEVVAGDAAAASMNLNILAHASMAPIIDRRSRTAFLKSLVEQMQRVRLILELDTKGLATISQVKGLDDNTFAKLYLYLKETMYKRKNQDKDSHGY